ncbi:hypothetical protein [Micromonospora sp. NBRC 101691]|nr:hypothetical protein [Micromonospora sp. NBRC 101691]
MKQASNRVAAASTEVLGASFELADAGTAKPNNSVTTIVNALIAFDSTT